jgi:hypothetical protein
MCNLSAAHRSSASALAGHTGVGSAGHPGHATCGQVKSARTIGLCPLPTREGASNAQARRNVQRGARRRRMRQLRRRNTHHRDDWLPVPRRCMRPRDRIDRQRPLDGREESWPACQGSRLFADMFFAVVRRLLGSRGVLVRLMCPLRRMDASLGRARRDGWRSVLAIDIAQGRARDGPYSEQQQERSPCAPCQFASPCRHVAVPHRVSGDSP